MATIRQILPFGLSLIGLTCTLAMAGCENSAPKYVGSWTGEVTGISLGNSVEASTFRTVNLIIKPDGTFELYKTGLPCSGNVEFGPKTAKLKVNMVMDRALSDQSPQVAAGYVGLSVEYVSPGKLVLHDRSQYGEDTVDLKKDESSTEQP